MPTDWTLDETGFTLDQMYFLACLNLANYYGLDEVRRVFEAVPEPFAFYRMGRTQWWVPHFLVATHGDVAVVCVHGTTDFGNQLPQQVIESVPQSYPPVPGDVHGFFGAAAEEMWNGFVQPYLTQNNFTGKILFTGHSLGAAAAQIMAHYAHAWRPGSVLGVVCFGSPRVGLPEFARANTWQVSRIENKGDPITNLPPGQFFNRLAPRVSIIWDLSLAYEHAGIAFVMSPTGGIARPHTGPANSASIGDIFYGGVTRSALSPSTYQPGVWSSLPHRNAHYVRRLRMRFLPSFPGREGGFDVRRLDAVMTELFVREELPWEFEPLTFAGPLTHEVPHTPAAQVAAMGAANHHCNANPGHICCRHG